MRHRILVLLLAAVTISSAQTEQMFIKRASTGEYVPYALTVIDALTLSGGQGSDTLNVKLTFGSVIQYPTSDIEMITFATFHQDDSIRIEFPGETPRRYAVSSIASLTFTDAHSPTSVSRGQSMPVNSFTLEQNYPNPFNPSTTIQYFLPTREHVTLTVSTILGQVVTHLVRETQEPGVHRITWNASSAPSGLYVYRLQTGANSETKAMILLK